ASPCLCGPHWLYYARAAGLRGQVGREDEGMPLRYRTPRAHRRGPPPARRRTGFCWLAPAVLQASPCLCGPRWLYLYHARAAGLQSRSAGRTKEQWGSPVDYLVRYPKPLQTVRQSTGPPAGPAARSAADRLLLAGPGRAPDLTLLVRAALALPLPRARCRAAKPFGRENEGAVGITSGLPGEVPPSPCKRYVSPRAHRRGPPPARRRTGFCWLAPAVLQTSPCLCGPRWLYHARAAGLQSRSAGRTKEQWGSPVDYLVRYPQAPANGTGGPRRGPPPARRPRAHRRGPPPARRRTGFCWLAPAVLQTSPCLCGPRWLYHARAAGLQSRSAGRTKEQWGSPVDYLVRYPQAPANGTSVHGPTGGARRPLGGGPAFAGWPRPCSRPHPACAGRAGSTTRALPGCKAVRQGERRSSGDHQWQGLGTWIPKLWLPNNAGGCSRNRPRGVARRNTGPFGLKRVPQLMPIPPKSMRQRT
ncbi:unnamed protein product, partial [Prorocentrum cordatum]